jgi:hypothetical protein
MTEPYVALFCHPKRELKIPHPPSPLSRGEQHCFLLAYHVFSSLRQTRFEAYVNMPNTLPDIITPWAGPRFRSPLPSKLHPSILLEIPHALAEQARSNQVQEACGDDEEDLE